MLRGGIRRRLALRRVCTGVRTERVVRIIKKMRSCEQLFPPFTDSTAYYSRDFSPIVLRILLVCPTVEYFGVKVFCKELFARAKIGKISIIKKSTDRLGGFQLRYIKKNAQLRTTLSSFSDSTAYYSRDLSPIVLRILLVYPRCEILGVKVCLKELFARTKIIKKLQ